MEPFLDLRLIVTFFWWRTQSPHWIFYLLSFFDILLNLSFSIMICCLIYELIPLWTCQNTTFFSCPIFIRALLFHDLFPGWYKMSKIVVSLWCFCSNFAQFFSYSFQFVISWIFSKMSYKKLWSFNELTGFVFIFCLSHLL